MARKAALENYRKIQVGKENTDRFEQVKSSSERTPLGNCARLLIIPRNANRDTNM